jgi:cytochrome c peroxidase
MLKTSVGLALIFFAMNARAFEALPDKVPVPADNPMSAEKIELGKQLYFEPRISMNGKISCNTCHNVLGSGTDNLQFSKGHEGKLGGRNSPTVWNSAFYSVQFWDGRAASLEDQAKGPMTNPVEMAMPNHDEVVKVVAGIPGYVSQFDKVFGKNSVTIDNIVKAIAAFERTLVTPDSPFDKFIKGDKKAMSAAAQRGMDLFQKTGCVACHSGPNFAGPHLPVGTGFYQKFPTVPDAKLEAEFGFSKDLDRYEVTKNEADKHLFRVPTLRNIALTYPYFHNGSVKRLEEAVRVMAKLQLNKDLQPREVNDIAAFLRSLSGTRAHIRAPKLPK